jgi:endonuclease YncB( thermonuclease family)
MRPLVPLLIFLVIASSAFAQIFSGKLVKVVDGDTFHVLKNGKAEKIRLADIDCPERKQPFGQKAKRYVLDVAAQKIVTVNVKTTDRYGRKIASITLPKGRNLNQKLIRSGLAWW